MDFFYKKLVKNWRLNHANAILMAVFLIIPLEVRSDHPPVQPLESYKNDILNSGGVLLKEQAAYEVEHYDIDLFVDPVDQTIHGSVIARIHIVEKLDTYVAHLDTVFLTQRVMFFPNGEQPTPMNFTHKDGLVIGEFPEALEPGEIVDVEVTYSGKPRVATDPPWEGGVTWSETPGGDPWIGVSCQMNGADIWWPVKDHPSDRPESLSMKITVPEDLVALSNGELHSIEQYSEDTRTYHWRTRHPVNNYAVTMNIGPYVTIRSDYESIAGDTFPIYFWALPESQEQALQLMEQVVRHMQFFEGLLGPYPFRSEKYGVVEAPFLGMEHQTLVAYGAGYENDVVFESESGFDDLHHHELAHEWWGNMVAVSDWKDFWIHEGFATYMQPLYAEELHGNEHYQLFMRKLYERITNNMAIAPKQSRTTREMFDGRDIYMKGAWVLHTLRALIGDDPFFESLRSFLYPDEAMIAGTARPPSRLVDTNEYIDVVKKASGKDLDWFFDTYLRYPELPVLDKQWESDTLVLKWRTSSREPFPMPVEVYDGRANVTVTPDPEVRVQIYDRETYEIDPQNQLLRHGLYGISE